MTEKRITEAQFSMQCSFIAKNAAAWAGDILTLPEHYNREAETNTVARFTDEMRERLDRLDKWAGRVSAQAPQPCGIADPSARDCQHMKEVGGGMDGERYRCAVCGKGYFLDYEEMK